MCLKHLLQTHGLCAQLNLVFKLRSDLPVLIFDRIQPYLEIQCGNAAASDVCLGLNAVAFSCYPQRPRKDGKFIQLCAVPAAFDSLSVNSLMFGAPLGGVRTLRPNLLVSQERSSPQAVSGLRQTRKRDRLPIIHGGTSLRPREVYPKQQARRQRA